MILCQTHLLTSLSYCILSSLCHQLPRSISISSFELQCSFHSRIPPFIYSSTFFTVLMSHCQSTPHYTSIFSLYVSSLLSLYHLLAQSTVSLQFSPYFLFNFSLQILSLLFIIHFGRQRHVLFLIFTSFFTFSMRFRAQLYSISLPISQSTFCPILSVAFAHNSVPFSLLFLTLHSLLTISTQFLSIFSLCVCNLFYLSLISQTIFSLYSDILNVLFRFIFFSTFSLQLYVLAQLSFSYYFVRLLCLFIIYFRIVLSYSILSLTISYHFLSLIYSIYFSLNFLTSTLLSHSAFFPPSSLYFLIQPFIL